jgi:hypothetical protein
MLSELKEQEGVLAPRSQPLGASAAQPARGTVLPSETHQPGKTVTTTTGLVVTVLPLPPITVAWWHPDTATMASIRGFVIGGSRKLSYRLAVIRKPR